MLKFHTPQLVTVKTNFADLNPHDLDISELDDIQLITLCQDVLIEIVDKKINFVLPPPVVVSPMVKLISRNKNVYKI